MMVKALSIYYDNLIEYTLSHIQREFEESDKMPRVKQPLSVVISGGTSLPKGFLDRFKTWLSKYKFPIPVGDCRMASHPLQSVARGALIAAMTETGKAK